MPSSLPCPAFRLLSISFAVLAVFLDAGTVRAQPAPPAAPPLTQQAEVAEGGFTVSFPAGWSMSHDANVWRLVNLPAERAAVADPRTLDGIGQILITVEQRRSHDEALRRLEEIRAESTARATFTTIGGWPALERRVVEDREQPGDAGEIEEREPQQNAPGAANQEPQLTPKPLLTPLRILRMTTAIAAGTMVVRQEARLPPDAPAALQTTVTAIGRSLVFRTPGNPAAARREASSLQARPVRRPARTPRSVVRMSPGTATATRSLTGPGRAGAKISRPAPLSLQDAGLSQIVINNTVSSEAEIAVSTNGQNIVIGQQGSFATSNDGGQTFPFTGNFPNTTGGDASLAFGRSGAFYEATISNSSTGFNVSTNNGQTFTFRANAFTCPASGANQCGASFPDQEHIAADRFNASAGGGDQVYSVWRHLNGNWGIVCSNDGGQNWGGATFTAGDFPRIAVGQDGAVYVVYRNGNNVSLSRFSSCTNGLTLQTGFPVTIATVGPNWVQCPVPGLDRCNNGNNLSSFTVAVDDTNANHIFAGYAQNTSATNENVILRDSTDGGLTWPAGRTVTVNGAVTARRFMPWICSVGGIAYASWFDRRAGTAASNSLTDFFGGSARVDASNNLVAGPERRINAAGMTDAQCAAGQPGSSAASWPRSARAQNDSDSCAPQPQLAGRCQTSTGGGSNVACDFDSAACAAGESCVIWARGSPKYGDYNGNACTAGRFYTVWPSAMTAPPSPTLAGRINLYYAALVVASSQIQIPGPVALPDSCVGSTSVAVANVCNTGTNDLHVDPITSSDPQFGVTAPSGGYPVTIAPGSCFPFQVRFTPTSPGNKTATLTVPSDDSVTPSATIPVSGKATQMAIVTAIADDGDFGVVAAGAFHDQPLVISNPGGCALTITGITSSSPDFQTAQVVTFPIVVAPGASVAIPIRFQPTSFGAKSGALTISNSDPLNPSRVVKVTGTGGAPHIVTSVVDTGSFGPVCVGSTRDLSITVTNSGESPLFISAIASSSPEFQIPQVLTFPLVVSPGTSLEVPIRFAPTTPGPKTATLTISSNDPAAPSKAVTLSAETPADALCHPPSFTSVGLNIGPTFGSSRMGDYTFSGQGRHLSPFGDRHTFAVQTQGEYHFYHGRHEGQIDIGVMNRWKVVQFGVYSDFKFEEVGALRDGGVLGQASAVLDLLFNKVRVNVFGTKGFKNTAVLSTDTTLTFAGPPVAGSTATQSSLEHIVGVVDTIGGGVLFGVAPNTDIDGNIAWLRRQRPTPLSDGVGAMARVTQHLNTRFALYGEFTLNETYLGPTNSGRVVFGFVFGRWTRPSDFTNKHTPLATEVPRVHFDLQSRQR